MCVGLALTPFWTKLTKQDELNTSMTQHLNRTYQLFGAMQEMEAGKPAAARDWPAQLRQERRPERDVLAKDIEAFLREKLTLFSCIFVPVEAGNSTGSARPTAALALAPQTTGIHS